jgi:hypothetical protein
VRSGRRGCEVGVVGVGRARFAPPSSRSHPPGPVRSRRAACEVGTMGAKSTPRWGRAHFAPPGRTSHPPGAARPGTARPRTPCGDFAHVRPFARTPHRLRSRATGRQPPRPRRATPRNVGRARREGVHRRSNPAGVHLGRGSAWGAWRSVRQSSPQAGGSSRPADGADDDHPTIKIALLTSGIVGRGLDRRVRDMAAISGTHVPTSAITTPVRPPAQDRNAPTPNRSSSERPGLRPPGRTSLGRAKATPTDQGHDRRFAASTGQI